MQSNNSFGAFNPDSLRQYCAGYNWPIGLINTLIQSIATCPIRYVIVDDSGSMSAEVFIYILFHI